MAGKEQSVRSEQLHHPLKQLALGWFVEVDHHIAAEDDIQPRLDAPLIAQQIDLAELDQIAQFVAHTYFAVVAAFASQKEAFLALQRQLFDATLGIDTSIGCGQNTGVDIRSNDFNRWIIAAERFYRSDRQRVRLFASARRRAPDALFAAAVCVLLEVLGQRVEMMTFDNVDELVKIKEIYPEAKYVSVIVELNCRV